MSTTLVDNLVHVFQEVGQGRLKRYILAKGWEKPKHVAMLFEVPTIRGLADQTKTPERKRDADLLALIATLPFREDVLLGEELDSQLAIIEAHRSKQPNEAARIAAEKLFRHYTATLAPEDSYRYYQLARAQGCSIDQYWQRQAVALAALLDDETRMKLDPESSRGRT